MQNKKIKSRRVQFLSMKRISLIRDEFQVEAKAIVLRLKQTGKSVLNIMRII